MGSDRQPLIAKGSSALDASTKKTASLVIGCIVVSTVFLIAVVSLASTQQALDCDLALHALTDVPKFGLNMRSCWYSYLALNVTFLNHGSYGAAAVPVSAAVDELRAQVDENPDLWFRNKLSHEMRTTAKDLAAYIDANASDVALVDDATNGINAVLRSLQFTGSSRILIDGFAYPSMKNTLDFATQPYRTGGANVTIDVVDLPYPVTQSEIVAAVEKYTSKYNYTLAIFDHISSAPAVLFPVQQLTKMAHAAGAIVFIDGAHAIGQIPLNLTALDADFYVTNGHKWLCAQRSAALLHVNKRVQDLIHPADISNTYGQGFTKEFDYLGTRDYTNMIGQRYALQLRNKVGDIEWRSYNNQLCKKANAMFSKRWDSVVHLAADTDSLSLIQVGPLPYDASAPMYDWDVELMWKALQKRGIWVPVLSGLQPYPEDRYFRISCQVYNVLDDYVTLADAFESILESGEARKAR